MNSAWSEVHHQAMHNGDLSHVPGDDDLLRLPIEINKRLFIDAEQPIVISIGWRRTTFRITQQKVVVKCLQYWTNLLYVLYDADPPKAGISVKEIEFFQPQSLQYFHHQTQKQPSELSSHDTPDHNQQPSSISMITTHVLDAWSLLLATPIGALSIRLCGQPITGLDTACCIALPQSLTPSQPAALTPDSTSASQVASTFWLVTGILTCGLC